MEEFYRKVLRLSFRKDYVYTGDDGVEVVVPMMAVRVTMSKSWSFHTVGIKERLERGIRDALGVTPPPPPSKEDQRVPQGDNDDDDVKILVQIHCAGFQISIDTSTTTLHHREYRLKTFKAPLHEDPAYP